MSCIFAFIWLYQKKDVSLQQKIVAGIMESNGTIRVKRTREEILAWLAAARQRKKDWEAKVEAKWAEEERLRQEAAESHYYDIECL